jgi:hypothetical protein
VALNKKIVLDKNIVLFLANEDSIVASIFIIDRSDLLDGRYGTVSNGQSWKFFENWIFFEVVGPHDRTGTIPELVRPQEKT